MSKSAFKYWEDFYADFLPVDYCDFCRVEVEKTFSLVGVIKRRSKQSIELEITSFSSEN